MICFIRQNKKQFAVGGYYALISDHKTGIPAACGTASLGRFVAGIRTGLSGQSRSGIPGNFPADAAGH